MFLQQDFGLFFYHDEVCCLMKRVLDRAGFVEGYPLSEFRLVPERFLECVDGYFVAYSADPRHDELESALIALNAMFDVCKKFSSVSILGISYILI